MFLAAKKHTIRQTSKQNQEKSVSHLWKTARSPTTIIRSPGFSVSCKGVFAIDGLTTTIGSAAIIHAIDIGLLQARCDAHLARHQVARGQTVHADGAHVLSHLPLGSRLRTTTVDGSAEDTKVVNFHRLVLEDELLDTGRKGNRQKKRCSMGGKTLAKS